MTKKEYTAAVEFMTRALNFGGLPRNLERVEKHAAEIFDAELGGAAFEIACDALARVGE